MSPKRLSICAEHLALWVDYLSQQPGFVHFSRPDGGACMSAWPVRQWSIPTAPDDRLATLNAIRGAHRQAVLPVLTQNHRSDTFEGGVAGFLEYELGTHTVAGFQSHRSQTPSHALGWAGLFMWSLVVPADDELPWLCIQTECPTSIADALAGLQDGMAPPATIADRFRLTRSFRPDATAASYRQKVATILDLILAGDCYQVNLSQRYRGRFKGPPFSAYQALRRAIPVPYAGYVNAGDKQVLSISPERLLRIRDAEVQSKPIKGTRPRGATVAEDVQLAAELGASLKDRAENLMIVDLIRNDLSRFCKPYSVQVPSIFAVESYENVHQLVSTVTGTLRDAMTAFDALLSAFPGGSITGAPKRRAMEIIDDLESHSRGPYCGSLFYWGLDGSLESNIAIRTLVTDNDGTISCWGGCGIVADSDPEAEYQESVTKIRRLMETLEGL